MPDRIAEHLIVGADLLGLSVADHLLRRGAERVVIIEASGQGPAAKAMGNPGLVLRAPAADYVPLEDRALLLLEEWENYLESDPFYRRTGSLLSMPGQSKEEEEEAGRADSEAAPPAMEHPRGESLGPDAASERWPGLVGGDFSGTFVAEDGILDLVALLSSLYSQVRTRGGQVHFDTELSSVTPMANDLEVQAGLRRGRVGHLYLTAGLSTIRHLGLLRIPSTFRVDTWHTFQFDIPTGTPAILRLVGRDSEESVVHDSGEGELLISCRGGGPFQREAPVDWDCLTRFRATQGSRLPVLRSASLRRGHASHCLALEPEGPGIISAAGGRLLAAGAFGVHGVLLPLAIGERMAEMGLDAADPTRP